MARILMTPALDGHGHIYDSRECQTVSDQVVSGKAA
jgi:hypothetical protein